MVIMAILFIMVIVAISMNSFSLVQEELLFVCCPCLLILMLSLRNCEIQTKGKKSRNLVESEEHETIVHGLVWMGEHCSPLKLMMFSELINSVNLLVQTGEKSLVTCLV